MGFVPLQLLLPSRFAEFGNGLGFAGCLGLVDWYLGVDFLDHATAVEGDKAGGGCLGQFGEICRRCFCAALVDHVVSEALGLGRWVQAPAVPTAIAAKPMAVPSLSAQRLNWSCKPAGSWMGMACLDEGSGSWWLNGLPRAPWSSRHPKPRIPSSAAGVITTSD